MLIEEYHKKIVEYYDATENAYKDSWDLNNSLAIHYGYWDEHTYDRAANELTLTEWDPVSKQPHFKYAAVKMRKLGS